MRSSRIYKALVGLDDGTVAHCEAVEYDETIWLVPRWLDFPQEGFRRPERMLRLDQFEHQMFPAPSAIDIAVSGVPHALYSGEFTQALKDEYAAYSRPDFRYEMVKSAG